MIGRVATVFVVLTAIAHAEPSRDEFAYEAPITLNGSASVYRAPLTASVYRNVTRADLGDIRVFNAAGEILPHGVTLAVAEAAKRTAALPLFPLAVDPDRSRDDVSLQVEVQKDGSIVKIKGAQPSLPGRRIYLLDASRVDEPLTALTIRWRVVHADGGLHRIQIDASDDLKSWRSLTQGILARLEHDGQVLERNRVELPRQRSKYLRIVPADPASSFSLTGVDGEFSAQTDAPRNWLTLAPQAPAKSEEQRYILDGKMPVDRARVVLAPNSVARVLIMYRAKDGDSWLYAGQKTVYRLETSGTALRDDEIRFGRAIVARQWMVKQTAKSGGGLSQITALALGWVPHNLVFVARGDPPFRLAYGRSGLPPVDYGVDELLRQSKRDGQRRVDVGEATLGSPIEILGARALRGGWTAGWKSYLLWTVLVLGVGVLALLAVRVGRQIGRGGEGG